MAMRSWAPIEADPSTRKTTRLPTLGSRPDVASAVIGRLAEHAFPAGGPRAPGPPQLDQWHLHFSRERCGDEAAALAGVCASSVVLGVPALGRGRRHGV